MKSFLKIITSLMLLSIVFVGCSDDNGTDPISTDSEYELFVNEIMTKNALSVRDENGNTGDWIEIYNAGNTSVDLQNFAISYEYINEGSPVNFDYIIAESHVIDANGFLLIWCDGGNTGLHTNFDLKAAKGGIVTLTDAEDLLVDEKDYSDTEVTLGVDDVSIARVPDGSETWVAFGPGFDSWSTPNLSNSTVVDPPSAPEIFINELMAKNANTILDPNGNYSDWVELYNNESDDVDISNWVVKYEYDDSGTPVSSEYSLPAGTSVPAGGYLLIWCDGSNTALFTNFDLKTRKGGTVTISDSNNEAIDFVTYTDTDIVDGADDLSYGRKNNGGGNWMVFGTGYERMPTPGASNR